MRLAIIVAMGRFRWLISLLLVIGAAYCGWSTARVYSPPADSGEARLLERALSFYRASATFDYETMSRLYTPAQQTADSQELNTRARRWQHTFEHEFDEDHRNDLIKTAEAVSVENLQVQLEGDWAVVKGKHDVYVEGKPVSMGLDASVWLRNGGDWWMYQLSDAELLAYGNPPDFARQVLFDREFQAETIDTTAYDAEQERQQLIDEQNRLDSLENPQAGDAAADK